MVNPSIVYEKSIIICNSHYLFCVLKEICSVKHVLFVRNHINQMTSQKSKFEMHQSFLSENSLLKSNSDTSPLISRVNILRVIFILELTIVTRTFY